MSNNVDIMAYDEARYLDIEATKADDATEDIELMNIGITKMDESSNPTEKSKQYVGDKSKTNTVTGYDTAIAIESDLIKNEAVVEYLYNIFKERKTGIYAQQYVYLVELWNPIDETANEYYCRRLLTTAVISDKTSTPGEQITFSGNLKGVGDFTYGTFNTETKTFTETV